MVGYSGSKLYCLDHLAMRTVELPLSGPLHACLQTHDIDLAYQASLHDLVNVTWARQPCSHAAPDGARGHAGPPIRIIALDM